MRETAAFKPVRPYYRNERYFGKNQAYNKNYKNNRNRKSGESRRRKAMDLKLLKHLKK
jgi:hypothetical protein